MSDYLIETTGTLQLDALVECLRFMVHRDQMNAAVHCSGVRWSPLTLRVARAIDEATPPGSFTYVKDRLLPSDVALLDAVLGP